MGDQHFERRARECREAAERTRDRLTADCFRAAAANFEAQAQRVARYRELLRANGTPDRDVPGEIATRH